MGLLEDIPTLSDKRLIILANSPIVPQEIQDAAADELATREHDKNDPSSGLE